MIELTIAEDGISPLLSIIDERLSNMTEPLTQILADGLFSAQQQVAEGKGTMFGGSGWAPMAESTIKKGRDPATLLVDSGIMLGSLTRGSSGNIFDVGPMEGVAGSTIPYASHQQYGSSRRPPRPFLAWYPEQFPIYDALILDWISGEAAGNS